MHSAVYHLMSQVLVTAVTLGFVYCTLFWGSRTNVLIYSLIMRMCFIQQASGWPWNFK